MKYHETDLYGTLLEELSHKGASAVIAALGYAVPAGKGKHNERSLAVLARLKAMTANELTAWVSAKTEKRRASNPVTMTPEELEADIARRQAKWDKEWAEMTPGQQRRYMESARKLAARIDIQEERRNHHFHTV